MAESNVLIIPLSTCQIIQQVLLIVFIQTIPRPVLTWDQLVKCHQITFVFQMKQIRYVGEQQLCQQVVYISSHTLTQLKVEFSTLSFIAAKLSPGIYILISSVDPININKLILFKFLFGHSFQALFPVSTY